jgi:hypothetical protein
MAGAVMVEHAGVRWAGVAGLAEAKRSLIDRWSYR